MRCPNCGTLDGRVIDSRDLDDSTTVRRRRECSSCRSRYTTYERVESARLIVLKTNGAREEFDRDKLAEGLKKALVRRPVRGGAGARRQLSIFGRREQLEALQHEMEKLRAVDHIAYIRFMSVYQSFDDIEQLKQEVDALYEERSDRVPGQTTLRLVAEDGAITPIGPRGTPRRRPTKRK